MSTRTCKYFWDTSDTLSYFIYLYTITYGFMSKDHNIEQTTFSIDVIIRYCFTAFIFADKTLKLNDLSKHTKVLLYFRAEFVICTSLKTNLITNN